MADLQIGRFKNKSVQMQNLLIKLLEDDDFVRLIYNNTDTPLADPIPITFDRQGLLKTHLYNQMYYPPMEHEGIIVCVEYARSRISGGNVFYKNTDITVKIIIHRNLWNIDGSVRPFDIADRVDVLFNREYASGSLSKEWFKSMKQYPLSSVHNVLEITYSNWD